MSRRRRMSIRAFVRANPFLSVGLLGLVLMGTWVALGLHPRDGGIGQALFYAWRVLAAPVHLAANLVAPVTDRWPDALDAAAVVATGLLPYVAADRLVRRWRARRRQAPAQPAAS